MDVRINKYLSSAGICSRREADRLLEENRVTINGIPAKMGAKVSCSDIVCVNGEKVETGIKEVLIAFNKPVGIVCTTTDKQGDNNIVDFIGYPQRIYPVGRLDKDSEGLILLTNNGEMMDKILRSSNKHEKEYIVTVNKSIDDKFIKRMSQGIYLKELERTTNPCTVEKVADKTFKIILTQGLNRQIRRMCMACGYKVTKLKRIRILNIQLENLAIGQYRNLTEQEYKKLQQNLE